MGKVAEMTCWETGANGSGVKLQRGAAITRRVVVWLLGRNRTTKLAGEFLECVVGSVMKRDRGESG